MLYKHSDGFLGRRVFLLSHIDFPLENTKTATLKVTVFMKNYLVAFGSFSELNIDSLHHVYTISAAPTARL